MESIGVITQGAAHNDLGKVQQPIAVAEYVDAARAVRNYPISA